MLSTMHSSSRVNTVIRITINEMCTMNENLLWVQTFHIVERLRFALLAFRETYNTTWLIQRLRYQTPDISCRPSGSAFTCGTRRAVFFMMSHQSEPVQRSACCAAGDLGGAQGTGRR